MSPEYQEYYQQLLSAFHSHNEIDRPEMERIEACFKSSLDCWGKVCKLVRQKGFSSEKEEIIFFKHVKPAFAAYIEYYTYRYHVLLFLPTEDLLERKRFWRWEEKRIERFYENNREFCRYMRDGETGRDAEYFLRKAGDRNNGGALELDEDLVSPKDHLVTLMKAYALYEEYIHDFIYINQSNSPL
ncbi:MAG: RteC domain-containing protein [Bacteroidetes bacterium]|nr:RteC domain-containing protein [Bacteroidota bacterium]